MFKYTTGLRNLSKPELLKSPTNTPDFEKFGLKKYIERELIDDQRPGYANILPAESDSSCIFDSFSLIIVGILI